MNASSRTPRPTWSKPSAGSSPNTGASSMPSQVEWIEPLSPCPTQFETLTAAALTEFAVAEVDVAVVEAGLGGRLDATNVLDAGVVVLTNVSLDHTDVLGDTREQIAKEKLAVVTPGETVVVGEPE